ncbi:MAG: hypothetical protein ACE5KE_11040 [Methanosarcinales archaeon]
MVKLREIFVDSNIHIFANIEEYPANARLKLQSVDSGIKVSGADDLLAQAEFAFKYKNWE